MLLVELFFLPLVQFFATKSNNCCHWCIVAFGAVTTWVFSFLLDNIFIWFGPELYRLIVGIHMGTNYAPLLLLQICFYFVTNETMQSLSYEKQATKNRPVLLKFFNSTSRYLDDWIKYWKWIFWTNGWYNLSKRITVKWKLIPLKLKHRFGI